jgi:putative spermidine/putrescine transport system ATP-binding protein
MPRLTLNNIVKSFNNTVIVDNLSLTVNDGEFVCLLGPSGCGKTTSLRIIAGFEAVDSGLVELDGSDITNVPPQKRDIGFVFQQYALFPHLTVAENVNFGLKMRRKAGADARQAVSKALDLVKLQKLGDRLPRQLSGGQQQRVALARALAIQPNLLLLDEPLSNLDAQLRDEMRDEIKRIQKRTGITAIFVTHDQSEALALADRVAVMSGGRLLQMADPLSIYESPETKFVGSFIGQSNILSGIVQKSAGPEVEVTVTQDVTMVGLGAKLTPGECVSIMIKKERIVLSRSPPPNEQNTFSAEVESSLYLGPTISYRCKLMGATIEASVPNHPTFDKFNQGDKIFVHWSRDDCRIFTQ